MLHSISIADDIRFCYEDFRFAGTVKCLKNNSRIAYFVHFFPLDDHFVVRLYQCNPLVPRSWQLLNCANPTSFPLFARFSSPRIRLQSNGVIEVAFLVADPITVTRRNVFDPYMAIINAFPPLHFCRFVLEGRQENVAFEKLPLKDFVYGDIAKLSLWPSESGEQWRLAETSMCDVYRLKVESECVVSDEKVSMPSEMREHLIDGSIDRHWSCFPAVLLRDSSNSTLYLGLLINNTWLSYMPYDIHVDVIFADSKFCFVGDRLISIRQERGTLHCHFIVIDDYSRTFQVTALTDVPFGLDFERLTPGDDSTVLLVRRDRSVRILFTNVLSLTDLCTKVLMKYLGAVKSPSTEAWSGGLNQSELRNLFNIKGDVLLF
uniref:Uncharacterized protein n=1 Tax=Plectus sambesii TaxID=2011161 RepID=A0A914WBC5_9BILA